MRRDGGPLAMGARTDGLAWRAVLAGVVCTFLVSLCLSGALALAVYVGSLGERAASGLLFYAGLASLAVGAGYGARRARRLGWAHGAAVGAVYVLASFLIGSLAFSGGGGGIVGRLLLGVLVGAAGGMVGMGV